MDNMFILDCLNLFTDTLNVCLSVSIFRFFAVFGIFISIVSLVSSLVRSGRNGRL